MSAENDIGENNLYVDAYFDRDADVIRVVERSKDGKREFKEYPVRYTFYYEDPKGKFQSIYGDPLSRIICKNTKDFHKEQKINSGKNCMKQILIRSLHAFLKTT